MVDDDPNTLRYVRDALSTSGYDPIVTAEHRELAHIIRTEKPHLILLDLVLPETDGIELMEHVPELAYIFTERGVGYRMAGRTSLLGSLPLNGPDI